MRLCFVIAIIVLLLVGSIPFLLSQPKGQRWINGLIKRSTDGKIELEKSEFSWLGPQQFTNIKYQQSLEQPIKFNAVTIKQSLPSFIFNSLQKNPDLNFSFNSEKLSIPAVASLLKTDPIIQKNLPLIAGTEIDVQGSLEKQDRLWRFNLKANNDLIQTTFAGQLDDGILTLVSPLKATVVATPEFTKEVLQSLIPLIDSPLTSNQPIQIEIESEGFLMPLKEFKVKDLKIGKGMLDIGNIELERPKTLTKIVKELRPDKNLDIATINLWFTPAYFKLNKGSLELKRVDILLLKEFPIAIWGNIDLINDQLQMTVGLPPKVLGKTMAKSFFKDKNLLPIPLGGTVKKPIINFESLITQLGGMAKWLFQDKEGNVQENNNNIPPPTSPLPWEK